MKRLNLNKMVYVSFAAALMLTAGAMSSMAYADNPCGATKNPCSPDTGSMGHEKQIKNSGNPCAVKKDTKSMNNPCAAKKDTKSIKNPCGGM